MIYHFVTGLVVTSGHYGFGHSKANRVCNTLTERTGADFHSGSNAVFGMTGRFGTELAERLDVVHAYSAAEYMQQRIQKHGSVTCGQNKSVAVVIIGILRVEVKEF